MSIMLHCKSGFRHIITLANLALTSPPENVGGHPFLVYSQRRSAVYALRTQQLLCTFICMLHFQKVKFQFIQQRGTADAYDEPLTFMRNVYERRFLSCLFVKHNGN